MRRCAISDRFGPSALLSNGRSNAAIVTGSRWSSPQRIHLPCHSRSVERSSTSSAPLRSVQDAATRRLSAKLRRRTPLLFRCTPWYRKLEAGRAFGAAEASTPLLRYRGICPFGTWTLDVAALNVPRRRQLRFARSRTQPRRATRRSSADALLPFRCASVPGARGESPLRGA